MITVDPDPERDPISDFDALMKELERFDRRLVARPMIVAVSKLDLPEAKEAFDQVKAELESRGYQVFGISSATRAGLEAVLQKLESILKQPADA
jgi:GTP-binding protein